MKYCYHCGRVTGGEPLFCGSCARTYDVKLCPRLHSNPRYATCCSQCGSRELSTPQPKVSPLWKVLEFLAKVSLGVGLVYGSLWLIVDLLKSPMVQAGIVAFALVLAVLWAVWVMLPEWFRKFVHRAMQRRQRRHER